MARTWFGEIGPCCCLPPLLNLPAAFSQPRSNHKEVPSRYRARLYSVQNTFKKDPGRTRQNSLATAGTHFTKPGAQNKVDPCIVQRQTAVTAQYHPNH